MVLHPAAHVLIVSPLFKCQRLLLSAFSQLVTDFFVEPLIGIIEGFIAPLCRILCHVIIFKCLVCSVISYDLSHVVNHRVKHLLLAKRFLGLLSWVHGLQGGLCLCHHGVQFGQSHARLDVLYLVK